MKRLKKKKKMHGRKRNVPNISQLGGNKGTSERKEGGKLHWEKKATLLKIMGNKPNWRAVGQGAKAQGL